MFNRKKKVPEATSICSFTYVDVTAVEAVNNLVAIRKEVVAQGASAKVIEAIDEKLVVMMDATASREYALIQKSVADRIKVMAYAKSING